MGQGRKKKRIERERLSPEDQQLVATFGEDIDLAATKRALNWLYEAERAATADTSAGRVLAEALDAHRNGDSAFFAALEKVTRGEIKNSTELWLTNRKEWFSKFNDSLEYPLEAHLLRQYFDSSGVRKEKPAFHEVKETLKQVGLQVEDQPLRRACRRVGLQLKPSRGWRGKR